MQNSDPSLNLTRGEADWRRPMQPALEPNLIEQILNPENLQRAWKRVKSNQGAPGIDGMRIEDFPDHAQYCSVRLKLR
jgi:RNA-directed DNA polymerase